MTPGRVGVTVLGLVAGLSLGALLAGTPAAGRERDLLLARGQEIVLGRSCLNCHVIGGNGSPIGPDLTHIGTKYDEPALMKWIRDPALHKLTVHGETLRGLTSTQAQALAVYLSSLR